MKIHHFIMKGILVNKQKIFHNGKEMELSKMCVRYQNAIKQMK